MTNSFYNPSGTPGTGAAGASAPVRAEFAAIAAGFALLPTLSGNGGLAVIVNALGTALGTTTGQLALAGNFATTGAFSTTLAQTASVTLTLPAVSGTLATLAGTETLSNKTLVSPALGTPSSGVLTNCTGTASGLTAGAVTTNANLTGPITSVGNTTSVAVQTGTGSTFVMNTSPTLVTPVLGAATGTSLNISGVITAGGAIAANGGAAFGTQVVTGGQYEASTGAINALGSQTGSVAINYASGNIVTITMAGALTITFSNWPSSGTAGAIYLIIVLDSTPHSVTVTNGSYDTNAGAPNLIASKKLKLLVESEDGGSTFALTPVGQF